MYTVLSSLSPEEKSAPVFELDYNSASWEITMKMTHTKALLDLSSELAF